jgi:hypothetical protein
MLEDGVETNLSGEFNVGPLSAQYVSTSCGTRVIVSQQFLKNDLRYSYIAS